MRIKMIYFFMLLLCLGFPFTDLWAQDEGEETYSISLTRTAETDKEIVEFEDKKVLTERYAVQKGDHLWKLLRERHLLDKKKLPDIISLLKQLNSDLESLDLIHPGQTIVIPLIISPAKGMPVAPAQAPTKAVSIKEIEGMDLESYTVKTGDTLIKVIRDKYDMPKEHLHDEYLRLIRKLNPSIENLDVIHPGQKIRLPIYSPQIVRKPIAPPPPAPAPKPAPETPQRPVAGPTNGLGKKLGELFTSLGEEWVGSGEHFIPIRSGGHMKLKAESFPILDLSNGNRIIIDLHNDLPPEMALLISSSWENYRVVHLEKNTDLPEALNRILPSCGYSKLFRRGEPLELKGDIQLTITADWIVQVGSGRSEGEDRIFMITILDDATALTPPDIRDFLEEMGIRVIDYPTPPKPKAETGEEVAILRPDHDAFGLIEMVLHLTGKKVAQNVEIPVYQSEKTDFNLVIKADFFINIDGKDRIIDLGGMGPDIVSLLRRHQIDVLTLAGDGDPLSLIRRTLEFIGVKSDPGPHSFMAVQREEGRNIRMTIAGIVFPDGNGAPVFATPLALPETLARLLTRKGFQILEMSLSSTPEPIEQDRTAVPAGEQKEGGTAAETLPIEGLRP